MKVMRLGRRLMFRLRVAREKVGGRMGSGREKVRGRRPSQSELPPAASLVAVQHPSATLPERPYDVLLIAAVLCLLGIGTIEIYSATAGEVLTTVGASPHFLERQILYVATGGFAMWYASRFDYRKLRQWVYPLLLVSLLLLVAVLGMPARNGA